MYISSHQSPPQPYQKRMNTQQQPVLFLHRAFFLPFVRKNPCHGGHFTSFDVEVPTFSLALWCKWDDHGGRSCFKHQLWTISQQSVGKGRLFSRCWDLSSWWPFFTIFLEDVFVIFCPGILSRWWFTFFWSFHPENLGKWSNLIIQYVSDGLGTKPPPPSVQKIQGCQGYPLARRLPGEPRPTRGPRSIDGTTSVAHLVRGGTAVAQMLRGLAARSEVAGKQVYRKRLPGPLGVLMLISSGSWHISLGIQSPPENGNAT